MRVHDPSIITLFWFLLLQALSFSKPLFDHVSVHLQYGIRALLRNSIFFPVLHILLIFFSSYSHSFDSWFFGFIIMNRESNQSLNVHSPYSLHPSENPATALVSPVLDPTNYNSLRRSMFTALSAKNKVEFVDGSLPQPASNHILFSTWKRCNDMVVSWLVHSVSTSIQQSILWMDNAVDIWKDLKSRYSQVCTHCGINGHTVDECFKKHGYPPGHRLYKPQGASINNTMTDDASNSESNDHKKQETQNHEIRFTPQQYQALVALL